MLLSGRTTRRAVAGLIASGAVFFGGAALASAEPPPPPVPVPDCTAGDLARASGAVGDAMADYLFSHPDVNDFFTSLRGVPNEEVRSRVQTYMDANPQVETDINAIRQPVTDLRNRCDAPPRFG